MLCLRVQHHSGTSLAYARLCEPSYGNGCIRIECVVAMGQTPHTSDAEYCVCYFVQKLCKNMWLQCLLKLLLNWERLQQQHHACAEQQAIYYLQLTKKWSQMCCFYISVISYLSFSSFYAVIWSKKLLHYLFISTNHLFIFHHEWMETFSTLEFICKLPCLLLKFINSVNDGCNFYV